MGFSYLIVLRDEQRVLGSSLYLWLTVLIFFVWTAIVVRIAIISTPIRATIF